MTNEDFFKQQGQSYRNKKFKIIQNTHSCHECECYGCYKHGECGIGCNNTKKQGHKFKPYRDYQFESWYKNAVIMYHAILRRLPEYPKQHNTLDLIRRGFVKNMDGYPRWKDPTSMVNIELDTIRQIIKELEV
jgi:hypothetical protein